MSRTKHTKNHNPSNPCNAILFHASMCQDQMGHKPPHITQPQSLTFFQDHLPAEGVIMPVTMYDQINALEHRLIQDALVASNGSVVKAARALGMEDSNKLTAVVIARHRDLQHLCVTRSRSAKKKKGASPRAKSSRTRAARN